jgi:predicted AAA+ superfamily ATPase
MRIERKEYLDWLIRWKEKRIVKVVSGVRRCGKSTMFDIFRDYLLENGVDASQIVMLNFEDIEYDRLSDYRLLYDYIRPLLLPEKMNYIFLDEIQHVAQFEKTVDSLSMRENCDVYITGSNAYFMSGELATLLSGRYVELRMLPLSFREFSSGQDARKSGLSRVEKFKLYVENGSFPYVLRHADGKREAVEYMRDVYNSVLLKDVVARLKISDVNTLENVTRFMFHNIGNKTSPTKISNTLKSAGRGVDQKTVDRYIRGLTDSLMFYESTRYNIKGRQLLSTQSKYYAVDVGLRNMLVRGRESDIGHVLENVVYLELRRRGYEVYVGRSDAGEVDFVTVGSEGVSYYQVAATVLNEETLTRELTPLSKIADNYPKFLLTLEDRKSVV